MMSATRRPLETVLQLQIRVSSGRLRRSAFMKRLLTARSVLVSPGAAWGREEYEQKKRENSRPVERRVPDSGIGTANRGQVRKGCFRVVPSRPPLSEQLLPRKNHRSN